MARVVRHDSVLLTPCRHCGVKPRFLEEGELTWLACPNEECGAATDEFLIPDWPQAITQWDEINYESIWERLPFDEED